MAITNAAKFYSGIRKSIFRGSIKQSQFEGIEATLSEWNKLQLTDTRWLAYILATIYHETAGTMQPIEEYGRGKNRTYGYNIKHSGKTYTDTTNIFYGRGYTQNTWYENYKMLTVEAQKSGYDWDFFSHPELLLQQEPSMWATFYCMINGKYTGKKLSDYFNETKDDPVNARRVINGRDKAELIAGYYKSFLTAFS